MSKENEDERQIVDPNNGGLEEIAGVGVRHTDLYQHWDSHQQDLEVGDQGHGEAIALVHGRWNLTGGVAHVSRHGHEDEMVKEHQSTKEESSSVPPPRGGGTKVNRLQGLTGLGIDIGDCFFPLERIQERPQDQKEHIEHEHDSDDSQRRGHVHHLSSHFCSGHEQCPDSTNLSKGCASADTESY